jgi:hypothetical protein
LKSRKDRKRIEVIGMSPEREERKPKDQAERPGNVAHHHNKDNTFFEKCKLETEKIRKSEKGKKGVKSGFPTAWK